MLHGLKKAKISNFFICFIIDQTTPHSKHNWFSCFIKLSNSVKNIPKNKKLFCVKILSHKKCLKFYFI